MPGTPGPTWKAAISRLVSSESPKTAYEFPVWESLLCLLSEKEEGSCSIVRPRVLEQQVIDVLQKERRVVAEENQPARNQPRGRQTAQKVSPAPR